MVLIESEISINSIQIINLAGAIVKNIDAQKSKNVSCKINDLVPGEYLFKINTAQGEAIKKVMKK
jgi:hypothetical protein